MHSKTKIVVLHMKELIYTGIFVLLGILFIVLLVMMFVPDKNRHRKPQPQATYRVSIPLHLRSDKIVWKSRSCLMQNISIPYGLSI